MTANHAGAASRAAPPWSAAERRRAEGIVRRLQARIVQATQAGRWHRVKALQHLLVHSHSARLLAVARVTESDGHDTPGVDGETWTTPEQKRTGMASLRPRGYRPQPLRRIYIPKRDGKQRPLGIPTLRDRAMQALYLQALDPVAETQADRHSYGFRKARSCADALEGCFHALAKPHAAAWVLEGDIRACFDRISHAWLLEHVPLCGNVLGKWLKAGYLERQVLYPTEAGTPQGGVISPVLANLALDGLEQVLASAYPKTSLRGRRARVNLVRYADDFVITGRTKELLEQEVKPWVEAFLRERGLELSPAKTVITPISEGFDFLGQNVRKYRGKLLIKPSRASVRTLLDDVREVVKRHRQATPDHLIWLLNPKLRGWAAYHRHVVSSATFQQVDEVLFRLLWHWAKRRHPHKSRHWVASKYYTQVGGRRWTFYGTSAGKRGTLRRVTLYRVSSTKIERHRKVLDGLNPYDPAWAAYLAERQRRRDARRQETRQPRAAV